MSESQQPTGSRPGISRVRLSERRWAVVGCQRRKGPTTFPLYQKVGGPLRARGSGQLLGGGERGEKFDLSEGVARFGDILNREGPIVVSGPRLVFVNPAVGIWQQPAGGGFAHDLAPAGLAWGVRRGAGGGGGRTVAREE